jgi:hypothetical protein
MPPCKQVGGNPQICLRMVPSNAIAGTNNNQSVGRMDRPASLHIISDLCILAQAPPTARMCM